MSGAAPDAESGREGFTCSALLVCLYLPGLSKKKPEEAISTSPPTAETAPDRPAEQQEAPYAPSRAASLEKSECASLYSRNNIVFDFVVEEVDQAPAQAAIHGYCPSSCFDLPVELIRAGERFGGVAADSEATTPATAAFVFDDGQRGGALKKMASCLAPGVDASSEPRSPHLLRFLSASCCSSVPRPLVMPSRDAPQGESVMVPACNATNGGCLS
ncbi:unnamed protein product [Miscanthus lutarioriparius]|uniref:Uncharacterized protein n=1 Tax=Miscanthus lutarioriparius TaxID=422564 RepID=A0A811NVJ8_9POAL|nr:unnamed protein product [Miscanthus lutarioriparius]